MRGIRNPLPTLYCIQPVAYYLLQLDWKVVMRRSTHAAVLPWVGTCIEPWSGVLCLNKAWRGTRRMRRGHRTCCDVGSGGVECGVRFEQTGPIALPRHDSMCGVWGECQTITDPLCKRLCKNSPSSYLAAPPAPYITSPNGDTTVNVGRCHY